ncbi:MAG: hypothetical protein K0R19_2019 [Bacillota bacterium]|jgi:hypothetical protein|nr:hypothetical protein [Bacillota bacterium]
MKRCEYCGSEHGDDILQCSSCGAKSLKRFCDTCGKEAVGGCICRTGKNPPEETTRERTAESKEKEQVEADNFHSHRKTSGIEKFLLFVLIFLCVGGFGAFLTKGSDQEVPAGTENLPGTKGPAASKGLTDMELLTAEGHPQFYGDFLEAESFWRNYSEKVKVVNARQTIFNEDALLLITTGDSDNNVITKVTINLSEVENKQDIVLDDALALICQYIPYDIIASYYTFEDAYYEVFADGGFEGYHYLMHLNDTGKAQPAELALKENFAFSIIHRGDNEWIASIDYFAYDGNHDKYSPGAYVAQKWDVDISQYQPL